MLPKSKLVSEGIIRLRPAGPKAWVFSVHKDSKQANVLLRFISCLWRGKQGKWIFTEHIDCAQLFPGAGVREVGQGTQSEIWCSARPQGTYSPVAMYTGRKEVWQGEADLLGRTVAHICMCRSFSKCFSEVFLWVRIHLAVVFILLMRILRCRN